jgi:hypothetical protein
VELTLKVSFSPLEKREFKCKVRVWWPGDCTGTLTLMREGIFYPVRCGRDRHSTPTEEFGLEVGWPSAVCSWLEVGSVGGM